MKLLVLGGTGFLGKNLVLCALEAGHDVTLFHRGQTNPGLFPNVEHIFGDRDAGLQPLAGRMWDAAVGTLDDESVETIDASTYGPLKALCEQAVGKML